MTSPADNTSLPYLPPRKPESHKGDYGRVLLIGGSRGMAGSISLSAMAALRGGAGLVKVAVPSVCQDLVAGFEPSYMTVGLAADESGRIAAEARDQIIASAKEATVLAIGPGLGRSAALDELVAWLYRVIPKPMVLDADALNALANQLDVLPHAGAARLLTPHPGEFARLVGSQAESLEARRAQAFELAARSERLVVVLKGHHTFVTDGKTTATGSTGNPGMATGGSGDVLTGLIAALLAQGMNPLDAAHLGVHLHGLAGDLAAADLGQQSLIASDLIKYLPQAFRARG
ncbi:MAG: NAD(P)H-hydrate dehydratase [Planctomycetales bacterium]|nr:NAD(P)H-hydrate dehydratase [Planctomycetales bacterium]